MTHHSLYQRLGRVDLRSYGVLVATILMIVVVSLIALAFVPQSWLTSYLRDADPTLSFLSVSEDAHYMLAPIFLSGAAPVFAFVSTFVILKAISLVSPLRASEREEAVGMDVIQHGEEAYVSGEGALLIRVAPKDQADIESEMEPVQ